MATASSNDLQGITETTGPNYKASRAIFDVSKNGKHDTTLYPEKRMYVSGGNPMTNAAIDWPVSWVLSLESLTQEEKEAILWKNLEKLLSK